LVIAACLRNADAVGRFLNMGGYATPARPVTVIAAGERWPDGSVRPALEDLLGAGAVITAVHEQGEAILSPEAEAARGCFQATVDIATAVIDSVSGRELTCSGFAADVAIATEINACHLVPVRTGRAFIPVS
jgi:2-phosphosulfolactate phosphatase